MYTSPRHLFSRTCLALAIAAASTIALAASTEEDIIAARQEAQIWTTFALSPYLRASDLEVTVNDGTATLTGVVAEDVNKDLARQIALGVHGIDDVDNQISVAADFEPAQRDADERSFGETMDDIGIATAVKSKLLWSRYISGLDIQVDVRDGNVTLNGSTDSDVSKELAGKMTANTHGVNAVDNQLRVSSTASTAAQEAGQQISDGWITTKVKTTLLYSSNVHGREISVTTTDGIVSLSGTLGSGAERALAIELARSIRGVKDVDASALNV